MKKRLGLLLFWLCCLSPWASAQSPVTGFCEKGGQSVVTNGVSSSTKVQRTYVGCTVSVFDAGSTNLSTIFSDGAGTPKANPFTADATTGYWAFYANNGSYDVSITASGLSATTIRTVKIADASSSPLSGSGTSGRVPKWSGTSSITNSQITDNTVSIGINNTSPAASALLDLTSTTQGLLPPRLTTTQRDAISSPANGLFIYNSTTGQFNGFQAGVWGAIGGGAGSGITSLNGLTGASQTFSNSNDVNVTLGINSVGTVHTFTMGWSGTLAKTRTLGTTVYTDQGNTFSAGAQDFSAASSFTIPVAGGANPTVSGRLAYDSTSNTLEYGANGVNRTVVNLNESQIESNKTLVAPNIGDFTGAQHSHQNAAGGGPLDTAAIGSGVFSLARGGTNTTSASYSTNGAFYYDGSKFITTAAGGAGTLCLQATDGGVPTFGSCAGSAATALSSITAATTSNTLNSGDNAQIWKWTLTTSGKIGWRIGENTASAAAGTPLLVAIDTLSTSTVNPFQVTAGGTANGIRVDTTGKLAKIGTGSVTADALASLGTSLGWIVQSSAGAFAARSFVAGTGMGITNTDGTGGNPTFSWTPATQVASFNLFDGTQASRTITFDLSGTDPVLTASSNKLELTTGNLFGPIYDKGGAVYNACAYLTCDGTTDDSAALATLISTTIPAAGGTIEVPQGKTIAIASNITIGNGTSTTASTRHNVVIRGASGHLLNMAGAVNPSSFKWTGASGGTMFTVTGPIGGIRFEHLLFDANSLANTAISSTGAEGLMIYDAKVINHKDFALVIDHYNPNPTGDFDLANAPTVRNFYANSSIAGSKGINVAPTGSISQLTLDGVRFTLQGGSNIGVRLGFTDSDTFIGLVGEIQIRPIASQPTFPQSIKIDSLHGSITKLEDLATWAPTTGRGIDIDTFATVDGETIPTDSANIRFRTDVGLLGGIRSFRDLVAIGASNAPATPLHVYSNSTDFALRVEGLTDASSERLDFYSNNSNTGTRNWALRTDNVAFGDFGIYQSATRLGNPLGSITANLKLGINPSGITNLYQGANVASAATIAPTGNSFHVTGTTTITSVDAAGVIDGTTITLIFDGVLTFTDGSNLKLAGNFVTTADDSITLVKSGTNWYEVARSVN